MSILSFLSKAKSFAEITGNDLGKSAFVRAFVENYINQQKAGGGSGEVVNINLSSNSYSMNGESIAFQSSRESVFQNIADSIFQGIKTIKSWSDASLEFQRSTIVARNEFLESILMPKTYAAKKEQVWEQLTNTFTNAEIEKKYEEYMDSYKSLYMSFETYVKDDIREAKIQEALNKAYTPEEIAKMKEDFEKSVASLFVSFEDVMSEVLFESQLENHFTAEEIAMYKQEYEDSMKSPFISFEDYMKLEHLIELKFRSNIETYLPNESIESLKDQYDDTSLAYKLFNTFEDFVGERMQQARDTARQERYQRDIEKYLTPSDLEQYKEDYENSILSNFISFEKYLRDHVEDAKISDLMDRFFKTDEEQEQLVTEYHAEYADSMSFKEFLFERIEEKKEEWFQRDLDKYFEPEEVEYYRAEYENGFSDKMTFREFMQDIIQDIKDERFENYIEKLFGEDKVEEYRMEWENNYSDEMSWKGFMQEKIDEYKAEQKTGKENNYLKEIVKDEDLEKNTINEDIKTEVHADENVDKQETEQTSEAFAQNIDNLTNEPQKTEFEERMEAAFSEREIEEARAEYEREGNEDQTFEEFMEERLEEREGELFDARKMGSDRVY